MRNPMRSLTILALVCLVRDDIAMGPDTNRRLLTRAARSDAHAYKSRNSRPRKTSWRS